MKGRRQTFLPNEGLCPTSCNLAIPQTAPSLKKTTNPLTSLPLLLRFRAGYSGRGGGGVDVNGCRFCFLTTTEGQSWLAVGQIPMVTPGAAPSCQGVNCLCSAHTDGTSQRETGGGLSLRGVSQVACANHKLIWAGGARWFENTPDRVEVSSVVPSSNPQSPRTGVLPGLAPLLFPSWLFQLQCGEN